jgi:RimJ/RimL family protein N-acetyltransferase
VRSLVTGRPWSEPSRVVTTYAVRASPGMPERVEKSRVIRPATLDDSRVLLAWRNDPDSWQWNHTAVAAQVDEHERWLSNRLRRDRPLLWIVDEASGPIAMARLDLGGDGTATVSISVDARHRGRGVASELLVYLDQQGRALGLSSLQADVHPGNAASHALFISAGYEKKGVTDDGFDQFTRALP